MSIKKPNEIVSNNEGHAQRSSPVAKLGGTGTISSIPGPLIKSSIHQKYRLTSVLKRDFAGVLYRTSTKAGGKKMAVKVLNPGYFVSSNTLLGNIDHSRICKIWDSIIEKDGTQAVVFEEPNGKCVSDIIADTGALTLGEAVSATLQLLSALHAVHWSDALVGNLHADSVFLSRDDHGNMELQLINFGIGCREIDEREVHYLSPEQVSKAETANRQSDIWAAGAIFYEMLFGKRPFEGANRYEIAGEILLMEPVFHTQWTNLPDDLLSILKKALVKDQRLRYENVTMMVADLLPFQEEFNEPISEAAANAIKDSYPPPIHPEKPSGKRKDKQPSLVKAIAKPFQVFASKTGGDVNKRTMLGMPAILPPQKSAEPATGSAAETPDDPDDVATDAKTRGEPGNETGIEAREEALADPSDDLRVDSYDDETGDASTAVMPELSSSSTLLPADMVARLLAVASSLSSKLRDLILKGLSFAAEKTKIAYSIAGGIAMLLLIIAVISWNTDSTSEAAATKPDAPAPAASPGKHAGERPSPSPKAVGKAVEKAPGPAALSKPLPETKQPLKPEEKITIRLKGLPPKAQATLNESSVSSPMKLAPSNAPVILSVTADGYQPYVKSIVPDKNQIISVKMEKSKTPLAKEKKHTEKKAPKTKPKHKTKKTTKPKSDLANNPFGA